MRFGNFDISWGGRPWLHWFYDPSGSYTLIFAGPFIIKIWRKYGH